MTYFILYSTYSPIFIIPLLDGILCFFFSKKARWFQLHCIVNLIVLSIINKDVYYLIIDPLNNIYKLTNPLEVNYVVYLHLYHFLFFKNSYMDYFHHILFVLFGAIPIYYYYNLNLIRLITFVGCGLPGVIEYFTLSLAKHNIITSLNQKKLISYVYNYFRFPVGIYGASVIYIYHNRYNYIQISNNVVFYVILLIYLNSAIFNKLVIENYIQHSLI